MTLQNNSNYLKTPLVKPNMALKKFGITYKNIKQHYDTYK